MGFIVDAIGSIFGHKSSNDDLNRAISGNEQSVTAAQNAWKGFPGIVSAQYAPYAGLGAVGVGNLTDLAGGNAAGVLANDPAYQAISPFESGVASQYAPFAQTGAAGLQGINSFGPGGNLQGVLDNDPVYQARLAAGTDAISRTNAAGLLDKSGGTLKALTRFGQQTGSDELNNIFGRYNTMANYGLDAASANSSAGLAALSAMMNEQNNVFNRNNTLAGYGLDAASANSNANLQAIQGVQNARTAALANITNLYGAKANNDNSFWGGLTGSISNGLFGSGGLFPGGVTSFNPFSSGTSGFVSNPGAFGVGG